MLFPMVSITSWSLYNKILISGMPPSSWTGSKVSLIYKKGETANHVDFQMIALSCTFGKMFHKVLANRTVAHMIDNNFLDPTIQKVFIQWINGTIKHNILLQEIIKHARANKHTAHISFGIYAFSSFSPDW